MTGPYGSSAVGYWDAGWTHVLPLPPGRKGPPPAEHTGWAARTPSYADVMTWTEDCGDGNVALHLPAGVIGLDVDDYGTKRGGATLADAEATWGPLPPTWTSTSRADGVSGIRLYRVPTGLRWPGGFGPGTETIHSGHRYAVVAPSIHPDTGRAYRWVNPQGAVLVGHTPPRLSELPELPMGWVVGMTGGREAKVLAGAGLDDEQIRDWCRSHSTGSGPCHRMAEAVEDTISSMSGGAHESLAQLMRVVGLAGRGHTGLFDALRSIKHAFLTEVTRPGRPGTRTESEAQAEWSRSLFGAVDKVVAEREAEGLRDEDSDPCVAGEPTVLERSAPEWEPDPLPVTAPDEENSGHEDRGEYDEPTPAQRTPSEQYEMDVLRELATLRLRAEAKQRLEAEHAPPFRALGWAEFKAGPRPEAIVPGMLYRDSLSRIFGAPGSGKSFLAMDLALSVATGRDWGDEPVRRGRVAYVMAEGQRVNNLRARAWQERHEMSDDEIEGWFYPVPDALALTEAAVGPFVAWVRETAVELIILDTKNAMMIGEENSATDSAIMRRALDAIRKATDACVILVDHTGKGDAENARGSSAVKAAMDTEVKVDNDGQKPAKVTITITRDKADEDGKTWELMLRHHPLPDDEHAAVLLPLGEVDLPVRMRIDDDLVWQNEQGVPVPVELLHFEGPGATAMPDLARFMASEAAVRANDPAGTGRSRAEAVTALKAAGHGRNTVWRAWSALLERGDIEPVPGVRSDTGRHVWSH